jgi:uncharacterized membrane protein YjgN (DUF898 family)
MGGDERTRFPPGHEPIVQRRPGDPRQSVPVAPSRPNRGLSSREDASTEPPGGPGGPGGRPPIESYSGAAPRDRMIEDGRVGELFVLFIINLLLSIVTLGIYRFWGKTRIRKYIWSRSSFRGERFEYSGTGMELFIGFLFAFLIFGPPFIGFYAWIYFDPPPQNPQDPEFLRRIGIFYLITLGIIILAFYFVHVATFAAYRYRLSRTYWRGIRGAVSGSAWTYGFLGFGLSMLNGLSLGWTKPWADTVLIKYRLNQTTIGSAPIVCNIEAGKLYPYFAGAWVITMVATILAVVGIAAIFISFTDLRTGRTNQPPMTYLVILVLLYLLIPVVWLATINFYRAAVIRQVAETSRLSGLSFRFPIRGWRLLWFNFSNFFLVLISLGLLLPLVILRYARLVAEYLRVEGDLDYAQVRQSPDKGPRYGEGIAEFFGMGVV